MNLAENMALLLAAPSEWFHSQVTTDEVLETDLRLPGTQLPEM